MDEKFSSTFKMEQNK